MKLNDYQKKLYNQQLNDIGPLPPAILALGLADRSGAACSAILDNTINGGLLDSPEMVSDVKKSIGELIAYCLQLYASLGIVCEEAIVNSFDTILSSDKPSEIETTPKYVTEEVDTEDTEDDDDEDDDENEDSGNSVFEH